jgi:Holliday junction resolvase RusA-like endonuclease
MQIKLWIPGPPATAGSKRAFANKKTGQIIVTHDCKKFKSWSYEIKAAAEKACPGPWQLLTGPIHLKLYVWIARPKSHYRSGRNADRLKDSAPVAHTQKPDLTKILRAVEDSLTGVVWRDDSQIVAHTTVKCWTDGHTPGTEIRIEAV